MFAPEEASPRVLIGVVAYGDTERLRACVDSLVSHASTASFHITVVVNPDSRWDAPAASFPVGVDVHRPRVNLGWAGGLHLARMKSHAEFFVWAQDDMVVDDGWLDALVTQADSNPRVGAVGSVEVDPISKVPNGFSGGYADPPDRVGLWNVTDVVRAGLSTDGLPLDWVTSKGLLTRMAAWDEVGGTDPRLFPLNHVDKDFSAHLRVHGWQMLLSRDARLFHKKHQSAPHPFRQFLAEWQEPDLDRTWGPLLAQLAPGEARGLEHDCQRAGSLSPDRLEAMVGEEASRLIVPFSRHSDRLVTSLRQVEEELAATRRTLSWRVTAPLRAIRRRPGRPR